MSIGLYEVLLRRKTQSIGLELTQPLFPFTHNTHPSLARSLAQHAPKTANNRGDPSSKEDQPLLHSLSTRLDMDKNEDVRVFSTFSVRFRFFG